MKPDWSESPSWANWLACDLSGLWFWHKDKPKPGDTAFFSSRYERATKYWPKYNPLWRETREKRPS